MKKLTYDKWDHAARRKRERQIDEEEDLWRKFIWGGHPREAEAWREIDRLCQERCQLYVIDEKQNKDPFILAAMKQIWKEYKEKEKKEKTEQVKIWTTE